MSWFRVPSFVRVFRPLFLLWSLVSFSVHLHPAHAGLIRVPNTTLRMPSELSRQGLITTNAFTGLTFPGIVSMTTPPGETNRLFVLQRGGQIVVITNLAQPTKSTFLDLTPRRIDSSGESGVIGLAFHPGYATNGYFFVFYSFLRGNALFQRVARFEVDPSNPNRALLTSERPLITQADDAGNHNGGDIHFGPDGYLYISVGDEGNGNDSLNNSQRIDKDFFSGILRIDVDALPENVPSNPHASLQDVGRLEYKIPSDNPWIGATQFVGRVVDPTKVRTEFFAVGLRNPWRMSFDPDTGWLYVGDVGQDRFEEVDVIVRGGNYGWAFREGKSAGPKTTQVPANTPRIDPIWDYPHGSSGTNVGNSITGGVVSRGQRLPQLFGMYVFGDYVSGNIWGFRYNGTNVTDFRLLATDDNIASFGRDPRNGDVLLGDLGTGIIKRLDVPTALPSQLPPTLLSGTGAFSDLDTLQVQPGIIPYEVNAPFWSDGAAKQRWVSVPRTNLLMRFSPTNSWTFPTGTVWIKHFELVTNELTQAKRRIETRFLVQGPSGVYGVTYRWNPGETNATLVAADGLQEDLEIVDASGQSRTQRWIYPSRNACLACHTVAAGGVLGFSTVQLNRDIDYGDGVLTNQIRALRAARYFTETIPAAPTLPFLVPFEDEQASLEFRVRSYLHANCSPCHRPGGTALGFWDARFVTPTSSAGLIRGRLNNSGSNAANQVVVPGSPELSMLLQRISYRGPGAMPPLGSTVVDPHGVDLLRRWIQSDELRSRDGYASWAELHFGDTNSLAADPSFDFDGDDVVNQLEWEQGTDPWDGEDVFRFIPGVDGDGVASGAFLLHQPANRRVMLEYTDRLFPAPTWQSYAGGLVPPYFPLRPRDFRIPLPESTNRFRYFRARVATP